MRIFSPLAACLLFAAPTAEAAMLRPFSQIAAGVVHLADLFDDLGATPDRALGRAPGPGERITVEAPQLAAIAHEFGVAWRPQSGAERAVVERRGEALTPSVVAEILRRALEDAGAPPRAEIAMPAFEPVLLPVGGHAEPSISQISYDAASGRFTALLRVTAPDMPAIGLRMSGQAFAMIDAVVPTRALAAGSLVTAEDVQPARVRVGLLHGRAAIAAASALGMATRHAVAAGQPLTTADLARPILVARGAAVRMTLESAGIDLAAQGLALDQGALGDRIRVQNPASHATVQADVTGADEVRVLPRAAAISLAAAQ